MKKNVQADFPCNIGVRYKKLILINPELEVGLNADLLFSTQALEDNEKDLASQHSQTRLLLYT